MRLIFTLVLCVPIGCSGFSVMTPGIACGDFRWSEPDTLRGARNAVVYVESQTIVWKDYGCTL